MFYYILKKEFLLLFRNLHALLVLFIMPSAFIIIMSIALQNTYSNSIDVKYKVLLSSDEKGKSISDLLEKIEDNNFFEMSYMNEDGKDKNILYKEGFDFIVKIPSNYLINIQNNKDMQIDIYTKPKSSIQTINLLKSLLTANISKQIIKSLLLQLDVDTTQTKDFTNNIVHHYISNVHNFKVTSVQQSVPSWLIFSMFFILIPISNTFINEKNFGTMNRIRSISISLFPILLAKVIPYYIINMVQVCFMIFLGVYLMPYLGVDALQIQGNVGLVFLISSAVSLAAISFALVIANIAKKSEDATSIGGISNILFAALGGIMVPKVIMPERMQEISELSPMSWALDSFLEVFVNGGTMSDIQNSLFKLLIFAIICFLIAYILLQRKK